MLNKFNFSDSFGDFYLSEPIRLNLARPPPALFSKRQASVLVPESNLLEGLDLTISRIWSFSATAKMPLTYYCYGEFIRQVCASPAGPIELSVA